MKIVTYNNGSIEKTLKIENFFRINIPKDYKDFLIKSNGCNIEDAYLYVKELNEYMLMSNFFGIDIKIGFADISKINIEYADDIPEESLLIGSDAGNGLLLLVNDGINNGVWYYDHSYFFPNSSDENNTYFICETFLELFETIKTTVLPQKK